VIVEGCAVFQELTASSAAPSHFDEMATTVQVDSRQHRPCGLNFYNRTPEQRRHLEFSEPSPRHVSPVLKGQLGDVAFASHSAQAVPSRQSCEVGAIEKHRTIESQEIHSR